MDLKLDKLFDVIYPDTYSDNDISKLKQKISNLRIDNMLNISKKKREQFFIIVSETKEEIDFRISPYFELIDPIKKVSDTEEYDFIVINEGLTNNDYENFSTNININLIDLHCNNTLTKLSIKKMIQEFNYPDEIAESLEQETELLNALYNDNSFDADDLNVEFDSDEEITNFIEETNSNIELEDTSNNQVENETNNNIPGEENDNSFVRTIKLVRISYLCGFDFQLTTNDDNELFVSDILEKGISDGKLHAGDKILMVDNLDTKITSYKDLIKYICSKLEITLKVFNKNIPKKKIESSISNFYRIMGGKTLKLSIFKKGYDFKTKKFNYDNVTHITTLLLSDNLSFPKILNYDNKIFTKENMDLFFSLDYFENYYTNFNEQGIIYDYLENAEYSSIFNSQFYEIIKSIRSGYYFNNNSIIWNIYLSVLLCSHVNDNYVNMLSYKNFQKRNTRQIYFPNYKKKEASCFESSFVKSINIVCDLCKNVVSSNLSNKYYNNRFGDICEKCYLEKKQLFDKRISYLKRLILIEGRKVLFSKEVEKTREFLKSYTIQTINNEKQTELIKKVNNSLISKEKSKICKICFEVMDDDLCASVNCGHCFHYSCIQNMGSFNCPACRVNTKYVKLFF